MSWRNHNFFESCGFFDDFAVQNWVVEGGLEDGNGCVFSCKALSVGVVTAQGYGAEVPVIGVVLPPSDGQLALDRVILLKRFEFGNPVGFPDANAILRRTKIKIARDVS